ncbi:hypothetical protein VPH35_036724 [Triticum aestivum]
MFEIISKVYLCLSIVDQKVKLHYCYCCCCILPIYPFAISIPFSLQMVKCCLNIAGYQARVVALSCLGHLFFKRPFSKSCWEKLGVRWPDLDNRLELLHAAKRNWI